MTATKEIHNQAIRYEIRDITSPYPSLYLTYKATSAKGMDRVKSIINSSGNTNLTTGTGGVYNDVEHNDYFSNRKDKNIFKNAGQVVSVFLEDDILLATSRVGKEHNIIDKNQKITGSSYASAWLTIAQDKIKSLGGNAQDHIPTNIWDEFFVNKVVEPYKNVSVEISFDHYPEENVTRFDGVVVINKWDLVRITFLTESVPGQQDSGFTNFEIRTVKDKSKEENIINNKSNNIYMNTRNSTIRCLCDTKQGDLVIDNASGLVYELKSINDDMTYTLFNVDDNSEITITKDEAENFDNVDSVMVKAEINQQTRSYLRMCMSCQKDKKKNNKRDASAELIPTTTISKDVSIPNAEIEALRAEINVLKELLITYTTSDKEVVRNDTGTPEEQLTKPLPNPLDTNVIKSIGLTDVAESLANSIQDAKELYNKITNKDDNTQEPIQVPNEVPNPDKQTQADEPTLDETNLTQDVPDLQAEANEAIRSFKPFTFNKQQPDKSPMGLRIFKR